MKELTPKEQDIIRVIREHPRTELNVRQICELADCAPMTWYTAIKKIEFQAAIEEIKLSIISATKVSRVADVMENASESIAKARLSFEIDGTINRGPTINNIFGNVSTQNNITLATIRKDYEAGKPVEIPNINKALNEARKGKGCLTPIFRPTEQEKTPEDAPETIINIDPMLDHAPDSAPSSHLDDIGVDTRDSAPSSQQDQDQDQGSGPEPVRVPLPVPVHAQPIPTPPPDSAPAPHLDAADNSAPDSAPDDGVDDDARMSAVEFFTSLGIKKDEGG